MKIIIYSNFFAIAYDVRNYIKTRIRDEMETLSKKDQHWYRTYKGALKGHGVKDADALYSHKHVQLKLYNMIFFVSIGTMVLSIPLMLLIIGIPMFLGGIWGFLQSKKMKERLEWGSDLFAKEELVVESV